MVNSTSSPAMPEDIQAQAADWIVQLTADDEAASARARSEFERWKQQDVRHAQAAAGLQRVLDQMDAIRSTTQGHTRPAHTAINAALVGHQRTRRIKKAGIAIVLACLCLVPAWKMAQTETAAYLMADMRTATGQRSEHALSDGTAMMMGSKSAVNIRFDRAARHVELVRGDILVDVAKDASRPFMVTTREGTMKALGTRFVVAREDGVTTLTMLESSVVVQTSDQLAQGSTVTRLVSAGEQIRITSSSTSPAAAVDIRDVSDAWQFGQIVALNQPLVEILDTLSRYRPGYIKYDRDELAGITMSVVLPMAEPDQALQLLVNSLPALRIRMLTPYLVYVDRPGEIHH